MRAGGQRAAERFDPFRQTRQTEAPVTARRTAPVTARRTVSVRQVRALLRAGLSTEVIRSVLPCARGERPDIEWCAELWDILNGELATMDRRIDDLQSNRDTLAGFLARP